MNKSSKRNEVLSLRGIGPDFLHDVIRRFVITIMCFLFKIGTSRIFASGTLTLSG